MGEIDINGGSPAASTKDVLKELVTDVRFVRDYVVAQQGLKVPDRVTQLERWQRFVVGFVAGLLGIETIRAVLSYVGPAVAAAVQEAVR
jgi:hypothetical protein